MDRTHDHDHDHAHEPAELAQDAGAPARREPDAVVRFQSVEDLRRDPSLDEARVYEIGKPPAVGDGSEVERRDFFKVLGVTFAAVGASACGRLPVHKAIPYVVKPEEITPGASAFYATACRACAAGCSTLVKSRDGRPIKVEGNPEHPLNLGGTCAAAQASVLDVYDGDRARGPQAGGKAVAWTALQAEVDKALAGFRADGSKLALVTRTVSGPASRAVVQNFLAQFPGARHVVYDTHGLGALAAAHGHTHGKAVVPGYRFDNAELILSFDADFLGTWLAPVAFTRQYAPGRKVAADKKAMSKHVHVETRLSVTGSNADERVRVLPSEMRALVLGLAARVAKGAGFAGTVDAPAVDAAKGKLLDAWAAALQGAKGRSLIVSGSTDVAVQTAVALANELLGNYGKTLDLDAHFHHQGGDAENAAFVDDLRAGVFQGVILVDVNPVYDSVRAADWAEGLKKTTFTLALSGRVDETASLCKLVAATHHPLEAWGDVEPVAGVVNVQQPLVQPLFDTRGADDLLLAWSGYQGDMLAFLQAHWQAAVLPRSDDKSGNFQAFWDKAVHDGFVRVERVALAAAEPGVLPAGPQAAEAPQPAAEPAAAGAAPAEAVPAAAEASPTGLPEGATAADLPGDVTAVVLTPPVAARFDAARVGQGLAAPAPKVGQGAYELVLYHKVAIGDGSQANNPLLQELPDPISKATWGNYVCLSPKTGAALGVGSSDVVAVKSGTVSVELPVVLQPGLHDGAVAIAVGYGRTAAGRVGNGVGANVLPFAALGGIVKVDVSKTGKQEPVAFSQTHHSYEHRDIVREATLAEWQQDAAAGNASLPEMLRDPNSKDPRITRSMWSRHQYPASGAKATYKWGMAVDLSSCTGCGACVIACNVENNIPIVGKHEVLVRREMHWLRIDRYFSERKKVTGYDWDATDPDLLELAENPEVVHQPMLCQHCDNAPCETVCPVLATVHTSEGLNAQVYNRCIGTRYCANNCPYKVRRFNWFNYPTGDMAGKQDVDLVALALNPDIVKRSRGVMEKCTFCVQRIQDAKSVALREGRNPTPVEQDGKMVWGVADGDVQTACQQACPADAITFGNMNDEASRVRAMYHDPRNYSALVEVGTQPAVTYMTKVRNKTREG